MLAHPLTEPGGLPVPPLVVATVAVAVVGLGVTAARRWWHGHQAEAAGPREPGDVTDRLSRPQWVTRGIGLVLLAVAIAAGRLGSNDELRNLAPALIVGAGWPLLVIGSLVLGDVWRWLNPWDTLARLVEPLGNPGVALASDDAGGEAPRPPSHVAADARWAVPAAFAWVWYLQVFRQTLAPRAVGAALAVYTIVTLAGCLVMGRRRWLGSGEVFTLLFAWLARIRRDGLAGWHPPRGAELVLGVLAGGLLFGMLRLSTLWLSVGLSPRAGLYTWLGFLGFCAGGALLLRGLEGYAARLGAAGAVTAAAVPAVASLAVAMSFGVGPQNRLLISLQLLPALFSDPFGFGWNLFGTAGLSLRTGLLTGQGRVLAQVLVLLAGHLGGALLALRRTRSAVRPSQAHGPAVLGVCALLAAGVLAFTAV